MTDCVEVEVAAAPQRWLADGRPWETRLPYHGVRDDLWGCRDGVTYLSDRVMLLRLDLATRSEEEPFFATDRRCRLVDVVLTFADDAWEPLPQSVPFHQDAASTSFAFVEIHGRLIDIVYFLWLVDSYGIPKVFAPSNDTQTPLYFRFAGGFAVLCPVCDRDAADDIPEPISFERMFPNG